MEWARAFSMDLNQVRDMFSDVQSAVSGIHKVEAITALGLYVCLKVFKKSIFVQEVHIHLLLSISPPLSTLIHVQKCNVPRYFHSCFFSLLSISFSSGGLALFP